MRTFAAILLLACCAYAAPNAAGTWTGTIVLDMKVIGTPKNAEEQERFDQRYTPLKKLKFVYVLKPGGAFTGMATGIPTQPAQRSSGLWLQSGDKVTMSTKLLNGKPPPRGARTDQTLTMSRDGKTMILPTPTKGVSVIYRRG